MSNHETLPRPTSARDHRWDAYDDEVYCRDCGEVAGSSTDTGICPKRLDTVRRYDLPDQHPWGRVTLEDFNQFERLLIRRSFRACFQTYILDSVYRHVSWSRMHCRFMARADIWNLRVAAGR